MVLSTDIELFPAGSGSLLESPFWCVTCVVSWVKLWYVLKPTTICVGSRTHLGGVPVQLMSGATCNQPWDTCLEIPHNSLFMAASTGPWCVWEEPGSIQGSASSGSELEQIGKSSMAP